MIAIFLPAEITLDENGRPTSTVSAAILKEVSRPFIVWFAPSGIAEYCRFEKRTSTFSKRLCLSLVSYLQFPGINQQLTRHTESTTNGSYQFQYRLVSKNLSSAGYLKTPVTGTPVNTTAGTPLNLLKGALNVDLERIEYISRLLESREGLKSGRFGKPRKSPTQRAISRSIE